MPFPILAVATVSLPIGRSGLLLLCLCAVGFPVYLAADTFLLAKRNRCALPKHYQQWWVYVLAGVVFCMTNIAVVYFDRSFVADAFLMPTRSMSPTIQPGDRFLVDKLWFSRNRINRGDVVVYRSSGPGSPLLAKRVAGLPGDEIEIENERVFVNGAEWNDPHAVLTGPLPRIEGLVDYGPLKVPPGCYFVLGDNRRNSMDSRMTGPIPLSDLRGIVRLIFWSREVTFPDPNNPAYSVSGPIHWERFGLRLD